MKGFRTENSGFMKGITESYLADLGRVIAAWSHVEQQFHLLFLSVVVMKGATGSMSNPMVRNLMGSSFDRQLQAFRERLKELGISDALATRVTRILDRLLTLKRQRDKVAHSVLSLSIKEVSPEQLAIAQGEAIALQKSWKNSKPAEFKPLKQDYLKSLFDKVHVLYWDLVELSLDANLRTHSERN